MSVYDNKVYPSLPSAPEDSTAQKYRLQKIGEIETFFLHEIDEREKLAKKFRRIGNSILIVDTGLIITTVISESPSIAAISFRCCYSYWYCSHWHKFTVINSNYNHKEKFERYTR